MLKHPASLTLSDATLDAPQSLALIG